VKIKNSWAEKFSLSPFLLFLFDFSMVCRNFVDILCQKCYFSSINPVDIRLIRVLDGDD